MAKNQAPPTLKPKQKFSEDEEKVLKLTNESGAKGISDPELRKELSNLNAEQIVEIVNRLISLGLIDIFLSGETLLYKSKDPKAGTKLKGADNEERVVYGIIEEAGNKGIWIRDIRFKSNLMPQQLNKILKSLEGKKMIKAVKSVTAGKKKVYMLYDLEPDSSLTGGAWYCDQDFEAEFVDVLNQQCYRFLLQRKESSNPKLGPLSIRNSAYVTPKEAWKFITDLGISKVQLSDDDIRMILDTLVYDGKVERVLNGDGVYLYRVIESLLPPPGIVRMPCGVCPVQKNCSKNGSVNPKICVYLNEWLS